ncbi:MAG: small ribosomal subunit biogenesis GTPase RsgA [Chromatiales bacterium]
MAKRRLSGQQKRRIAQIQQQRRERLASRAEQALDARQESQPLSGTVIARHGQNLVVQDQQQNLFHCLSRQNIGDVACGDEVVWEQTGDGEGVVTALLPRKTLLSRPTFSSEDKPLAANISQLVIVIAPEPEPSEYLIDQYLVAATRIGVKAIIALNKADLLDDSQWQAMQQRLNHYRDIGYDFIRISARQADGLKPLLDKLAGETSILVGQSGVGKSSLTNALIPDLDLQTNRLSQRSGLGQHTTSASTLYHLPQGGRLIDSPGVRSFRLGDIDREELENGFVEFHDYLGHCRFSNCSHSNEPGCALIAAVEAGKIHPQRLENFRHMAANLKK